MNSALITGANGFVGSHLCKELAENDIKVFAVVREKNEKIIKNDNIEIISCDLEDIERIPSMINQKIDTFYHFGWNGAFGDLSKSPSVQSENIKHTCDSIFASKKVGCDKFIFPGTIMSHSCMNIVSEDYSKPGPRNIYYAAKQAAHIMAKTICFEQDVGYIDVNITNIYGPGSNIFGFVNDTLIKMIRGEPVSFTSGTQNYDFIYITDAVAALRLLGEMGEPFCSYYLGSEHPKTIKQYVELMKEYSGSTSNLKFGSVSTAAIGLDMSLFNIHRLRTDLNFEFKVDFDTGIYKTIEWLKKDII